MNRTLRPSTSEPNLNKKKNQPIKPKPGGTPKKLPTRKPSKTLEDKRSSSSDHESDTEGSIKFLRADLVDRIKKYDQSWFEAIRGFEAATFGLGSTIFYTNTDCLQYIDIDCDNPRVDFMRQTGEVTALTSSPDHSVIAFGVNDSSSEGGAAIRVLDAKTLEPLIDVIHSDKVLSMCISQGSEALVALSAADQLIKFNIFNLKEYKQMAFGELIPNAEDANWEVSFCPADEGIICCFGGGFAYLLRVLNGYVERFSQIQLEDVTCHSWASDVTMAFGTTTATIRLYRETLALKVIDLSETYRTLLDREIPECKVVAMTFTIRKFAVATQNGILLVFPMHEGNPSWKEAISIVLNECRLTRGNILSFDLTEENLVYSNGSKMLVSCLRHVKGIVKDGGRLVTMKHLQPIMNASISAYFIATMDTDGEIIVSSRATGKVVSYTRIKEAIAIFFGSQQYQLLVVTNYGVTTLEIAFHALEAHQDVVNGSFVYCCCNHNRSLVALFEKDRFDIYRTDTFTRICGNNINLKKGISKAIFSDDDEFMNILGHNDQIFVHDCRTGELVWCVETKLQFYTDIMNISNNVYALNKRFAVTRFKNGKEMGILSMHTSAIGYQSSSHSLVGRGDLAFLGTECGQILASKTQEIEDPILIMQHCHYPLSYLTIVHDHLIIGSKNGCVVMITLELTKSVPEEVDDRILYSHNRIYNFTHLIKEIDMERNIIRKETESFVNAYTKRRDDEVDKMRDEYDRNIRAMKERVKKIEEAFEQSEQEKQTTIANLKRLYEEEFEAQETKHDSMIREHISAALRTKEEHKDEVKHLEETFAKTKEDMTSSFHNTEQRLVYQKDKFEEEIKKKEAELEHERSLVAKGLELIKKQRQEFQEREGIMNEKRKTDIGILEKELWNEKATSVQLAVQRDRANNDYSKEKTTVLVREERIEELENDMKTIQAKCNALIAELEASRKTEFTLRLNNKKVTANLDSKTGELEETRVKAHKLERKLREIEARLDDISKCVYNSRILEHKVLGLLAFLNDHPHV